MGGGRGAGSRPSSTGRGDVRSSRASSRSTSLSNCDVSPETVTRICQPSAGGCCDFSVRKTPVARRALPRPFVRRSARASPARLARVRRSRSRDPPRSDRLSVDSDDDIAGHEAGLVRGPSGRYTRAAHPRPSRRPPPEPGRLAGPFLGVPSRAALPRAAPRAAPHRRAHPPGTARASAPGSRTDGSRRFRRPHTRNALRGCPRRRAWPRRWRWRSRRSRRTRRARRPC